MTICGRGAAEAEDVNNNVMSRRVVRRAAVTCLGAIVVWVEVKVLIGSNVGRFRICKFDGN